MSDEKGIKKFLSKIKIEYLIVGILTLICICVVFNGMNTEKENATDTVAEYVSGLEDKLENTLNKLSGAGKVNVIISVESGMETVLATTKTSDETKTTEEPFTVGGKTVVLTETYPKIVGVIIVAEGANNLSVRVSLINATAVFLNVEKEKIQILPMKT